MTAQSRDSAHWVVIGAGWSGLACAVEAARLGVVVTLVDAAPAIGGGPARRSSDRRSGLRGRQRTAPAARRMLRNDRLMRRLGVDPHQTLLSLPFMVRYPDGWRLGAVSLPAPLHLAFGLARARRGTVRDRLALAAWVARQRRKSVAAVRRRPGRGRCWRRSPTRWCAGLWRPLCIAAMNAEPAQASSQMFLNLLRLTLGATERQPVASDTAPICPHHARSGTAVPRARRRHRPSAPAGDRAGAIGHGWSVQLREQRCRPTALCWRFPRAGGAPARVGLDRGAAPAISELRSLQYEPIATVYLRYPNGIRLPNPLCAARRSRPTTARGNVFDRAGSIRPNQGIFSVVIGAPALRVERERDALCSAARPPASDANSDLPAVDRAEHRDRAGVPHCCPRSGCDGPPRVLRPRACTWRRHRGKPFRRRSKARAVGLEAARLAASDPAREGTAARAHRWQSSRETRATTRRGKR